MDDFLLELRALDETQDRVEAVSDEMLKAQSADEAKDMVNHWMSELRTSDFNSERVAFLYVSNHVLQKTQGGGDSVEEGTPDFVGFFGAYMEEAVSLVSNSPMDRQNVTRLLELWHEKEIYPDEQILRMWTCTGEDLPVFLVALAAQNTHNDNNGSAESHSVDDVDHETHHVQLPTLPMKLNTHSANPILDALKQIDHHKAVIQFLDQAVKEKHQYILLHAATRYQTPEDLLTDRTTTPAQMRQRVEDCLRLVKIRNKYMSEIPALKEQLQSAVIKMKNDEWSKEAYACSLRRRRKEEEQRQREEQMSRLHQEAIAESAAHAMHLEADFNGSSSAELQSLSKELGSRKSEKEVKPEETNEMVWHPMNEITLVLNMLVDGGFIGRDTWSRATQQ
ncbi:Rna polymerase ii-binding domain, partial [Globisporangium splendens]